MTPAVILQWHAFLDGGQSPEVLSTLLHDDCVFSSPALFSPQRGRIKSAAYLGAAAKMFSDTDFHYEGEWYGEHSAVLEFAATIDGKYINGVDMIGWNDDDLITSFKVMIRPFTGLQLVMGRMADLLTPG